MHEIRMNSMKYLMNILQREWSRWEMFLVQARIHVTRVSPEAPIAHRNVLLIITAFIRSWFLDPRRHGTISRKP
jgi:hypothetical protein